MRLIDADDLKARAREEAVAMEEPWKSKFAILVEWLVDKTFTAYDVEAKVAELEKEYDLADKDKARCIEENPLQYDEVKGYARGIDTAISIVRGKEQG